MNRFLSYDQVIKLPLNTKIFSESKREKYQIVYNLWKIIVKRIRSDWYLEKRTKELSKQEIENNYYKISKQYIKETFKDVWQEYYNNIWKD